MSKQKDYLPIESFELENTYHVNPLMTCIKLARFKFAAKMLSKSDIVLDLGCGNGYSSHFFSKFCQKVIGVDLYSNIENVSNKFANANISFYEHDILKPLPEKILDENFTSVIAIDVIEHFYQNDGISIIKNYSKKLPIGGMFILGTPNKYSEQYRSKQSQNVHFYEYKPLELKEICDEYFSRTLLFSMNDEIVHTGFYNLAWFFYIIGIK